MDATHLKISPEMLLLISEIDEFNGSWNASKNLPVQRLKALKWATTIESVGASSRLGGANLSDAEVDELLSNMEIQEFTSSDEQAVAGYGHVLHVIYELYKDIPLTETHIKQLHAVLFHYSPKDAEHRGHYKSSNEAHATLEMQTLIRVTNEAFAEQVLHPLIIIGMFIVRFLAIQPFQKGNERLSRILTALLLLKQGYSYLPYTSHESILEAAYEDYVLALRRTQNSFKIQADENPWLIFFFRSLRTQKETLKKEIENQHLLMQILPELTAQILDHVKKEGRATVAQILKGTGAKRPTIKSYLTQMVKNGALARHGVGRSTWYTLP